MRPSKRFLAMVKRMFNEEQTGFKEATWDMISWISGLKPDPKFDPKLFESEKGYIAANLEYSIPWVTKQIRTKKEETLKILEEKTLQRQAVELTCKYLHDKMENFLLSFLTPQRLEGGCNRMDAAHAEFVWEQWQTKGKFFKRDGPKYDPLY